MKSFKFLLSFCSYFHLFVGWSVDRIHTKLRYITTKFMEAVIPEIRNKYEYFLEVTYILTPVISLKITSKSAPKIY